MSDVTFRGRYMLVDFGYTFCPDVCPIGLDAITQALDLLPAATVERIQPIMITVDPERDTPERLAEYLALFHPQFLGLTGTEQQIRAAAEAYRVVYAKADGSDLYDHSSVVYLMDADGRFLTSFSHATPPERMAEEVVRRIR